jgi:glycosyltransferase involved in cell wall biosynthesis
MATGALLQTTSSETERLLQLSVVIPVYDEAESLEALAGRLLPVLKAEADTRFEIIFVDDGSMDGSWEQILKLHATHGSCVRALRHRRNFGKAAALSVGFAVARGRTILTMDADLQD